MFSYKDCNNNYNILGYCGKYKDFRTEIDKSFTVFKHKENKHKFHKDGHNTPEQAKDCYLDYIIDNHLNRSKILRFKQLCEICNRKTRTGVGVSLCILALCHKCNTIDNIKKLFRKSGCLWP